MFGALRKFGGLAGVAALLRSPAGRQLIGKAKALAADPKNRQKVMDLVSKAGKGRSTPPTRPVGDTTP